ncbi:hypothetical protein [Roseibium aggregatum]|uniref:hypothetical protein n=1 Tax=Roseibium aggregatum TaxID=187304 RepID=UPI001E5CECA0|nr:hypothetical protein [Roseibium aggregatum]UES42119.1 hypothetical protein GFC08_29365 [Roseibium aggregatum]
MFEIATLVNDLSSENSTRLMTYLPAVGLLFTAAIFSVGLLVTKNAGSVGSQSVAVFPPWWSQQESFAKIAGTGASIAAPGPFDWMVVVVPASTRESRSLKASGALVLLNSEFARLCGIDLPKPISTSYGSAT